MTVGGVSMRELGQLEIELLVQLRFELLWDPSVLERVAEDILARMPAVDAKERPHSPRPMNRRHPSLFCAQVPATGPAPVIAPVARPAPPSDESSPGDEDTSSARTSSEEPSSPASSAPSSLPSDQESPDPAQSTSMTPRMKATVLTPRTPPAAAQRTFSRE